eukprot:5914030-Pyramimonas_sp.AAC.1
MHGKALSQFVSNESSIYHRRDADPLIPSTPPSRPLAPGNPACSQRWEHRVSDVCAPHVLYNTP